MFYCQFAVVTAGTSGKQRTVVPAAIGHEAVLLCQQIHLEQPAALGRYTTCYMEPLSVELQPCILNTQCKTCEHALSCTRTM